MKRYLLLCIFYSLCIPELHASCSIGEKNNALNQILEKNKNSIYKVCALGNHKEYSDKEILQCEGDEIHTSNRGTAVVILQKQRILVSALHIFVPADEIIKLNAMADKERTNELLKALLNFRNENTIYIINDSKQFVKASLVHGVLHKKLNDGIAYIVAEENALITLEENERIKTSFNPYANKLVMLGYPIEFSEIYPFEATTHFPVKSLDVYSALFPTFQGTSGAPVFDDHNRLIGISVGKFTDKEITPNEQFNTDMLKNGNYKKVLGIKEILDNLTFLSLPTKEMMSSVNKHGLPYVIKLFNDESQNQQYLFIKNCKNIFSELDNYSEQQVYEYIEKLTSFQFCSKTFRDECRDQFSIADNRLLAEVENGFLSFSQGIKNQYFDSAALYEKKAKFDRTLPLAIYLESKKIVSTSYKNNFIIEFTTLAYESEAYEIAKQSLASYSNDQNSDQVTDYRHRLLMSLVDFKNNDIDGSMMLLVENLHRLNDGINRVELDPVSKQLASLYEQSAKNLNAVINVGIKKNNQKALLVSSLIQNAQLPATAGNESFLNYTAGGSDANDSFVPLYTLDNGVVNEIRLSSNDDSKRSAFLRLDHDKDEKIRALNLNKAMSAFGLISH
jgi:hypothetical protein